MEELIVGLAQLTLLFGCIQLILTLVVIGLIMIYKGD